MAISGLGHVQMSLTPAQSVDDDFTKVKTNVTSGDCAKFIGIKGRVRTVMCVLTR